jgi:hypothetical protein
MVTMVKLALREVEPCGPAIGPEDIADEDGVVYSASRGEVYVFGAGTSTGSLPTAWTHSLSRDQWIEIALAKDHRPGDVLAATYRLEDGHIYALDRLGDTERLRRWDGREAEFETLTKWPDVWRQTRFRRRWLIAGLADDLFIVGTKRGLTMLVRLGFEDDGTPHVLGTKRIFSEVLARPIPGADGIGVTIVTGGNTMSSIPMQEFIRFEDFTSGHRQWQPRF